MGADFSKSFTLISAVYKSGWRRDIPFTLHTTEWTINKALQAQCNLTHLSDTFLHRALDAKNIPLIACNTGSVMHPLHRVDSKQNKKVLLRQCKRHNARRVASVRSAALCPGWDEGTVGTPSSLVAR